MKKSLPYVIVIVAVVLLGALLIAGTRRMPHRFDERITLNHRDKIPYGTAAAQYLLPSLFPGSSVIKDRKAPGMWDSIINSYNNQAVILISKRFDADDGELNRLLYFAQKGNYVFIIARSFSRETVDFFRFYYNDNIFETDVTDEDSLSVKLEHPYFTDSNTFVYPGKKYETSFYALDTAHTEVLGRNKEGNPDFIKFRVGKGSVFIHTAPLTFSNYFILHKNNEAYFRNVLSVIPASVDKIDWNEYYLSKPSRSKDDQEPNWFRVLLRYPAFKYGLFTGLATLFLMIILGMRRKQAMVPGYEKPHNDSLDFVKTLGRLYHDKGDHLNLANKMAVYFLDHVRNYYKISTEVLDESLIQSLHYKSGYPEEQVRDIVSFINSLKEEASITDQQLATFHKKLELFYQNT